MSVNPFRGAMDAALIAGLVFGAGAIAHAQQDASQEGGRVVQIGRADDAQANNSQSDDSTHSDQAGLSDSRPQEAPKYWIGLRASVIGDDDPLRAHLELAADQGLLVVEVVPDSPAAKAGLEKYDILLRANDVALHEMNDLIELVGTEGEKKGQITLDVLRHGQRETLYITPEERPENVPQFQEGGRGEGFPEGLPGNLLGQLERGGQLPFNFRNFGPGVIIGGQGLANVPNGVSVSIQKEQGKPAHITVKRGGKTWEVVGDDPESLKKLPDDLRPFVERILQGASPMGTDFPMPHLQTPEPPAVNDRQLRQRLDRMERQMQQLLEQLGPNHQQADQPNAEQEEAK